MIYRSRNERVELVANLSILLIMLLGYWGAAIMELRRLLMLLA